MISDALSIARKEFTDTITSKRLWLIVGVLLLFSVASTYSTIFQTITAFQQAGRPVASVFSAIATTMAYMAPLLGIALAFDAVSGERERGTLRILLSRPIYREDVINGKIISALTVISLATTISSLAAVSISILLHNVAVTIDDIARICLFIVFSIVLSFAYYAFSLFISTLSNKSSHSLIISIGIWIFFAFILSVISSLIVTAVLGPPPMRSFQAFNMFRRQPGNFTPSSMFPQEYLDYMRKEAEISSMIQAFSINYHYTQITSLLFGYATRPIEFGQGGRTLVSIPTVISTRLIDIVILIVFPIIFLFASYMVFTRRQEK
ncbi:MAG: ABC transporter permease [Candidatus Brockarchaeota archaeon]|nr:ABC transporter permease [Candidatus Brockarchaeota archaeon]